MKEKVKNILITGAGKGIGMAVVQEFINSSNHQIIAVSRNIEALEDWKRSLSLEKQKQLSILSLDITTQLADLANYLHNSFPEINACINNAGYLVNKPFYKITKDDLQTIFQTNVFAAFQLVQIIYKFMPSQSHIVNIGSMGGFQGSSKFPGLSAYSASKGALGILSECLAEELKTQEIAVNCLALGSVQTEMLATAFPNFQSPTNPQEMAEFICHFTENGHRWFNGKNIPVSISVP